MSDPFKTLIILSVKLLLPIQRWLQPIYGIAALIHYGTLTVLVG